ncbi:MAG: ATP-binding cassette domain-containing protein [candidate division Zixibacteria bacterium]|nr:ATP-binding cassette domain-containing protein [candidate division Zixibacteria bacterium]
MNKLSAILEAHSLTRVAGETTIIDDFTYSFAPRNIYSIVGPSGAGKSSLLRLLNRLDEPTSGEVFFNGVSAADYPPEELRRKVGYLFQTPYLFPETVRDNLLYANPHLTDASINQLLDQIQVNNVLLDKKVQTLSVGQSQRVAIGRLLAVGPEVLLLDEPTSALDPAYTEAIEKTILALEKDIGLTVIVVTHHPDQALRLGGTVLLLVEGKLVEYGPSEQVISSPQTELGRKYQARQLR